MRLNVNGPIFDRGGATAILGTAFCLACTFSKRRIMRLPLPKGPAQPKNVAIIMFLHFKGFSPS